MTPDAVASRGREAGLKGSTQARRGGRALDAEQRRRAVGHVSEQHARGNGGPEDARRGNTPVLVIRIDGAGGQDLSHCEVRVLPGPPPEVARSVGVTAVLILRDATAGQVASSLRAATRGGSLSPELLDRLLPAEEGGAQDAERVALSEREHEVLLMLAEGATTRGIAEKLSYSERTVKNIVHDILEKLECKTRAHAVALAVRRGVI